MGQFVNTNRYTLIRPLNAKLDSPVCIVNYLPLENRSEIHDDPQITTDNCFFSSESKTEKIKLLKA